jgi:hypothetical protein
MAIPETAQKDLIGELQRDRPKLVVFTNDRYGLPQWDGVPNMVRHYDVSQYILDHYQPLVSVDGQILYGDASARLSPAVASGLRLSTAPISDGLPFRGLPCDWGTAPEFLKVSPPPRKGAPEAVLLRADSVVGAEGIWRLQPPAGETWSAYRWLEVRSPGGGLPAGQWTLADSWPSPAQRQITFKSLPGRSAALRVYVGSCAQWHGYDAAPLYLSAAGRAEPLSVRLLP